MTLYGDYHTHTVFSHGKGSIEDNAGFAVSKGLRQLAVADHGFNHIAYGVRRRQMKKVREQVAAAREKYPELEIFVSVEANLLDSKGHIDVLESDKQYLDIVVCGYHKFVYSGSLGSPFTFLLPNNIGSTSKRTMVRNTDAYVKALEKNTIDILSHPGNFCKCDIREVARACKHFGTYFELNGKRIKISDEELGLAAGEDCEFIVNSDAHTPDRVGDVASALAAAGRVGIPVERIANIDRLPSFRSRGGGTV